MEIVARYRGRNITESDLAVVKQIMRAYPDGSRRFISKEVCKAWGRAEKIKIELGIRHCAEFTCKGKAAIL